MTGKSNIKIIILHRYFWPQQYPYAQMLKDIAETLAEKHEVSILTTDSGSQNEKRHRTEWSKSNTIEVKTLSLGSEKKASLFRKAYNSLYFGLWACIKLITLKTDIVMVATTPPVVIASVVRWVSYFRKFKYVYHCQDIHPEAMLLGGNIKKNLLYKILLHLDKKNINSAWKVITLSEDMKKTLVMRGCKSSHVNIINNFIFEESRHPAPNIKSDVTNFIFAGSLGRLQNLGVLIRAIALINHRNDITFTILGDGIMLKEMTQVKEKNKLTNVRFLGQVSLQDAVKMMHSADVGVISIGSGICKVAYPSKTMMYLGNGLPVFALVDRNTEIYNFINDNKLGIAISPSSPEQIAKSIELYVDNFKLNPVSRVHVKNTADDFFGKDHVLIKYSELYS